MKFEELDLLCAVYDVRANMEAAGEQPGSEYWTTDEEKRTELTRRILQTLECTVQQRLIDAWIAFRKSPNVNGKKKAALIVEVARLHGRACFYAGRGLGQCSEDVDLERLIPETRGGQYTVENCVLSCSRHNRMRGDTSLEEMLRIGQARAYQVGKEVGLFKDDVA